MSEFRVRKADDNTGHWTVADGVNYCETYYYINAGGIIVTRYSDYWDKSDAQAALDLYLQRQRSQAAIPKPTHSFIGHSNGKLEVKSGGMRTFGGGATRDNDDNKLDYEGFCNPLVDRSYAEYLNKHRKTANGLRDSDNWQSLFGEKHLDVCIKSLCRHVVGVRLAHRGYKSEQHIIDSLNAAKFNINAYLLRLLLEIEGPPADLRMKA